MDQMEKKIARCRLTYNINNYTRYKRTKITNPKENYQTSFKKKNSYTLSTKKYFKTEDTFSNKKEQSICTMKQLG